METINAKEIFGENFKKYFPKIITDILNSETHISGGKLFSAILKSRNMDINIDLSNNLYERAGNLKEYLYSFIELYNSCVSLEEMKIRNNEEFVNFKIKENNNNNILMTDYDIYTENYEQVLIYFLNYGFKLIMKNGKIYDKYTLPDTYINETENCYGAYNYSKLIRDDMCVDVIGTRYMGGAIERPFIFIDREFDFRFAKISYDGKKIYHNRHALDDLLEKKIILDIDPNGNINKHKISTTFTRVIKYLSRGFEFVISKERANFFYINFLVNSYREVFYKICRVDYEMPNDFETYKKIAYKILVLFRKEISKFIDYQKLNDCFEYLIKYKNKDKNLNFNYIDYQVGYSQSQFENLEINKYIFFLISYFKMSNRLKYNIDTFKYNIFDISTLDGVDFAPDPAGICAMYSKNYNDLYYCINENVDYSISIWVDIIIKLLYNVSHTRYNKDYDIYKIISRLNKIKIKKLDKIRIHIKNYLSSNIFIGNIGEDTMKPLQISYAITENVDCLFRFHIYGWDYRHMFYTDYDNLFINYSKLPLVIDDEIQTYNDTYLNIFVNIIDNLENNIIVNSIDDNFFKNIKNKKILNNLKKIVIYVNKLFLYNFNLFDNECFIILINLLSKITSRYDNYVYIIFKDLGNKNFKVACDLDDFQSKTRRREYDDELESSFKKVKL